MTRPREGSWPRWRRLSILWAADLTAAACGQNQATTEPTASAHPTAVSAPTPPAAPLSEWQKRGATEVPPVSLQVVSLEGIRVVNQTSGAVSEEDAVAWAGAFLRGINFEYWAVNRQQDRFLLQSGLSASPVVVFQPDLADIDASRKAKSRIEYTRKVFRRMVLRPVPEVMRPTFNKQLVTWKPYAFYLDAVGPATKKVTDSAGRQTTQTIFQPGEPAFELVGGEMVNDPLMGQVFTFASDWNCLDASNRRNLAPLCNP